MKFKSKKNIVLNIIILVSICVISYGIINMILLRNQYRKAENEYSSIQEEMNIAKDEDNESGSDSPSIQIDLDKLKEKNSHIVGWIYYPCLSINYPIMQDKDNLFYIKHTFSKDENASGSIFLDCDAKPDFSERNSIIYGHNMKDGSMFGRLSQVRKDEILGNNPYFYIYTENGWNKYKIFSYHNVGSERENFKTSFETDEDYNNYLESIKSDSERQFDTSIDCSLNIVSLVTCTNDEKTRFVVHGIQTNISK